MEIGNLKSAKAKTDARNAKKVADRAANKRNAASMETDSSDGPQKVPAAVSPVLASSPSKKTRRTSSAWRRIVPQAKAGLLGFFHSGVW